MVRTNFLRLRARSPSRRISRATRWRPTVCPWAFSWLDGQARAAPDIGVLGEAFRTARTTKVKMPADPLLHIELAWP
ncbi:hypothetical protein BHS05_08940 [Myxococcus xanthus]|nr:hypothetical protein BHS05_08940 [Myxococcus xanthus]